MQDSDWNALGDNLYSLSPLQMLCVIGYAATAKSPNFEMISGNICLPCRTLKVKFFYFIFACFLSVVPRHTDQ